MNGEDLTWIEAANTQWAYRAENWDDDTADLAPYGRRAEHLEREERQ